MDHLILRLGEVHTVMAQLHSIGAHIESSGIDCSWTEADMYGMATAKWIIDGYHVKRETEAHTVTLHPLFIMYEGAFFKKHPHLLIHLQKVAKKVDKPCAEGSTEKTRRCTHSYLIPLSLCRFWKG